jgi:hypothetical protein
MANNNTLLLLIEESHNAYARYELAAFSYLRANALGRDRQEMHRRMQAAETEAKRAKKALLEYLGLA